MPKIETGPNADTMLSGLEHAKTMKLSEINGAYETAIAALTPTYPDSERLTFDKQEAEARAYIADSNADTPLLSALAEGRGIDRAELVRRVIAKADAFSSASGLITGLRQRYEDMLDAATTVEAVNAIPVTYNLPGQDVA